MKPFNYAILFTKKYQIKRQLKVMMNSRLLFLKVFRAIDEDYLFPQMMESLVFIMDSQLKESTYSVVFRSVY